jgi:hypothetical protein
MAAATQVPPTVSTGADPTEKIIVMGDSNAYEFSDGYVDTVGTITGTPTPPDQVVLASNPLVRRPSLASVRQPLAVLPAA